MGMELFEAIRKRHSYRGPFENQEIPEVDLKKIVEAAIMAPSGRNYQTTEFVIINQPALVKQIAEIIGYPFLRTAKTFIVCLICKNQPVFHRHTFEVEDCAAATENMLLAITALGYAAVWIDGALRQKGKAAKIAQLLHAPRGKKVRIVLPVGKPAEQWEQKQKKSFHERAWFNSYPV